MLPTALEIAVVQMIYSFQFNLNSVRIHFSKSNLHYFPTELNLHIIYSLAFQPG